MVLDFVCHLATYLPTLSTRTFLYFENFVCLVTVRLRDVTSRELQWFIVDYVRTWPSCLRRTFVFPCLEKFVNRSNWQNKYLVV